MLKPKNYYVQQKRDSYHTKKSVSIFSEKIIEILESILKIALFLGVIISWFYFSFYVEMLPSFSSVGDVTGYLIFIVIWSIIESSLMMLLFVPSIFLKEAFEATNVKHLPSLIVSFLFFALIPLLAFVLMRNNETEYFYWYFLGIIFLVPSIFSFLIYVLNDIQKADFTTIVFVFVFVFIFYAFISTVVVGILYNESDLSILPFFLVLIVIYMLVLKNKLTKNNLAWYIIIFIVLISTVLAGFKIDNPIITKPFEVMKIGHYNAEIHFKKDFIEQANPFEYNDKNQTYSNFFVLCSIGDDYIIQELYSKGWKGKIKNSNNKDVFNSVAVYFKGDLHMLYYTNNHSYFGKIWTKDDKDEFELLKTENSDLITQIMHLQQYTSDITERTYIINKDKVDYVKTGGFDIQTYNTSWIENYKIKLSD